jgi:hypothetical protein
MLYWIDSALTGSPQGVSSGALSVWSWPQCRHGDVVKWERCGLQNRHEPVRFRPSPLLSYAGSRVVAAISPIAPALRISAQDRISPPESVRTVPRTVPTVLVEYSPWPTTNVERAWHAPRRARGLYELSAETRRLLAEMDGVPTNGNGNGHVSITEQHEQRVIAVLEDGPATLVMLTAETALTRDGLRITLGGLVGDGRVLRFRASEMGVPVDRARHAYRLATG